jgi:hypothetical protein
MPRPKQRSGNLDTPWKEALDRFLESFLAFFFPAVHAGIDWRRGYEPLDKELHQIIRDARLGRRLADKLFKVWRIDGEEAWLLIHVEVQGKAEAAFAERMFVYNYRIYELYHRPVVSLAVLCDDRPGWRPRQFRYSHWGCTMGLEFPVVKLLDYAPQAAALESDANPFAAVVLAHLKAKETRRTPAGRLEWKLRLVKGLYGRGWNAEDVRQLFRVVDWLMDLPAELQHSFREEIEQFEEERRVPYVTSIERLAKEEGREEGRQEGLKEGLLEAIALGLEVRFKEPGLKLLPKVRAIEEVAKLRALARALKTGKSLDEVRRLVR